LIFFDYGILNSRDRRRRKKGNKRLGVLKT
jgi:hypothetical protein